jgi:hypothetical protein
VYPLAFFVHVIILFPRSGLLSDSEAEDDPDSHVTVPQKLGSRGSQTSEKSSIRVSELGPRMTLQVGLFLTNHLIKSTVSSPLSHFIQDLVFI